MLSIVLMFGCQPEDPATEVVEAVAPAPGELLIEELYYSGATENGGADHYFSDQFIELVNASDLPLDLSGIRFGDAYGVSGPIGGSQPNSFAASNPDEVVLESVWKLPDGVRLEVGETLVIAQDGTNHRPFSTLDLSGAAFETYVAESGRDDDHPTVENLESIRFNGGFDWLVPVGGATIVVLDADTELGRQGSPIGRLSTAPNSAVLDAVEALMNADAGAYKRLPDTVDSGFTWVSGAYVGESIQRRQVDGMWVDTDNSGDDFEVGLPSPGRAPDPDGVFGDGWVDIGVGRADFTSLDDGDAVELVAGVQGGWHIDVAIQFGGFGPNGVQLVYDAVGTDGSELSYVTQTVLTDAGLLPGEEGWTRVGDRIVLDINGANAVVDTDIIVRVTAELEGQTWSDECVVRVADNE